VRRDYKVGRVRLSVDECYSSGHSSSTCRQLSFLQFHCQLSHIVYRALSNEGLLVCDVVSMLIRGDFSTVLRRLLYLNPEQRIEQQYIQHGDNQRNFVRHMKYRFSRCAEVNFYAEFLERQKDGSPITPSFLFSCSRLFRSRASSVLDQYFGYHPPLSACVACCSDRAPGRFD
jgi:hypothetical protein